MNFSSSKIMYFLSLRVDQVINLMYVYETSLGLWEFFHDESQTEST